MNIKKPALISLNDAAKSGILRVRRPVWASPFDHIKIDIFDGRLGPWSHLYAPFNKECNGRDPVDIINIVGVNKIFIDPDQKEFVEYTGPTSDSDEYKAEVAAYEGALSKAAGQSTSSPEREA